MRLLAAIVIGLLFGGRLCLAEDPRFGEREALAKLQAMDVFPDLEREDSELATQVAAELKQLESEQPAFFKEPAWPVRVARRVAARLGIQPRTVAQIRAALAESFDVDSEEIQRIHGIAIVSARFSVGGEWLDVTPQITARVSAEGLVVDCGRTLAATLADETQFERNRAEDDAEFWKRQRKLLAAVADARDGMSALQITYEFQSERATASAKDGERLTISEDGKVAVSKIAPAARPVKSAAPATKVPKK